MLIFTIDSENNIAAHGTARADKSNSETFASEKELAKLSAEWPGSRLIEIWNSFAGVAPFTELGRRDDRSPYGAGTVIAKAAGPKCRKRL